MIHIVLDTNIYWKSPRLDSPEFKALSFMVKKGCVCLHVPYIVEKEFLTYLEIEQRKKIVSAIKSISSALNYEGTGEKTNDLSVILEKLKADEKDIVTERSASFIDWLNLNSAGRHPLTLKQSEGALEAYFNGSPPLKEPKTRKHIPDSFIYQKIMELKSNFGNDLTVVINDGDLRSACENAGILCFDELSKFLKSENAQECLKQPIIDVNKQQVLEYTLKLANSKINTITDAIENLLLSGDYRMIHGDKIPGENREIYVSSVDRPHSVCLEEVVYFSGGLFVIYFSAQVELIYEYPVFRSESYHLDSNKFYITPLNDHYVDVETTDEFSFCGRVEIEFGEDIVNSGSTEELLESMINPKILVDELVDFGINE
jgi:hypothetical protein